MSPTRVTHGMIRRRGRLHPQLDPRQVVEAFLKYPWYTYLCVLPGGRRPTQMTDGANGYDCIARAIVSPDLMDPAYPTLRQTIFDFERVPKDERVRGHVLQLPNEEGEMELVYRLNPGQRVLVGIGFATAMPKPMVFWLAPRSGLASKYGITLGNAPGTVDYDYRGEAGAIIINNGQDPFDIRRGMRIVQVLFGFTLDPTFIEVPTLEDLPATARGANGFGSTGIR